MDEYDLQKCSLQVCFFSRTSSIQPVLVIETNSPKGVSLNDPFEFYPSITDFFNPNDIVPEFNRLAPAMFVRDLTEKLLPQFQGRLSEHEVDHLISLLLLDGDESIIRSKLDPFKRKIPGFPISNFLVLRRSILSEWPRLMEKANLTAITIIPETNKKIQAALVDDLASKIGVVCLSHCENQPLMWAHYADSHRGAMIVFDRQNTSFTKKEKPKGRMGILSDVTYSTNRPTIDYQTLKKIDLFQTYTLTKSKEWAYEKECRLILELGDADLIIEKDAPKIHLLSIDRSAVKSIVFGCNANTESRNTLIQTIQENPMTRHVSFFQSVIDKRQYSLNYAAIHV